MPPASRPLPHEAALPVSLPVPDRAAGGGGRKRMMPAPTVRAVISAALQEGRTALALQPVVQGADPRRIAFHEGLIRVLDRAGQVVPARDFMPACEGHAIARRIDCAALGHGIEALESTPDLRLSVNISAGTINDRDWLRLLEAALRRDPTIGERLIVEITEGSAIADPEGCRSFMARLASRGICFALDDFGTGATSLRHLRDFRFDILKIAGCYARSVAADPDNRAIVSAVTGLARHFEMLCIAEGVETADDAATLLALGVEAMQGYHFGAPRLRKGTLGLRAVPLTGG